MNILVLGNSSVHTARFANQFVNNGDNVYLLSNNYHRINRFDSGVHIITFLERVNKFLANRNNLHFDYINSFIRIVYSTLFINRIIRKYNIDAVLGINLAFSGPVIYRVKKNIKKVVITIGNDYNITKFPNPGFIFHNEFLIRQYCKRIDKIISYDIDYYKPMIDKRGWNFGNWEFIHHFGIEVNRFKPDNSKEFKSFYNFNHDSIIASTLRPARMWFDYDNILNAVKNIVEKHTNFYYIIGKGDNESDVYLRNLISELDLSDNVILADVIAYHELHKHVAIADIYIDPINLNKSSLGENSGISTAILEAMSCGLIPVAPDRPSIRGFLPENSHQFIFEDFDKDLTDKLELAILMRNNQEIKSACRNAVVKNTNWDKNFEYIMNLFVNN
ncbi:MAG: glycosyltransferase family 4 protein [Ignavibacteriae bacterium]|nr:glycosyltransferase family 4 protein [Ignavibacteriota bacterium]